MFTNTLFYIVFFTFLAFIAKDVSGQDTFIKFINDSASGSRIKVLSDGSTGWIILDADSAKIHTSSKCGVITASKKYNIPSKFSSSTQCFVQTSNKVYINIYRTLLSGRHSILVMCMGKTGKLKWNKYISNNQFEFFPYTIVEKNSNAFILYANVSQVGGGSSYNAIMTLDSMGVISSTKMYNLGGIWGGATLTSDKGLLIRTGSRFIKTDVNGAIEWVSLVQGTGDFYLEPIEVQDGYIFTSGVNNGKIKFHKINKQGNLLWGGSKSIGINGNPTLLRKKANGNFVMTSNFWVSGKSYPTIIEFDSDLNIIKKSSMIPPDNAILIATDLCLLNDGTAIIAGSSTLSGRRKIFYAKTDNNYQLECDTIINFAMTSEGSTQSFSNVTATTANFTSNPQSILTDEFWPSITTHCEASSALFLELGDDISLCSGDSLTLKNLNPEIFDKYYWSTGETTATITVKTAGTYHVTAGKACNNNTTSDSITVSMTDFLNPILPTDTLNCRTPVILDANVPGASYKWQDGSVSPIYYATESGTYYVDITYQNCTKRLLSNILDCDSVYLIPNVFTPNNDAINDVFKIIYYGEKPYSMRIFNRWGTLLFESNDSKKNWTGKIKNGEDALEGTYFYLLWIGDKRFSGFLTLLR